MKFDEEIFGSMIEYELWTDQDTLNIGDEVNLVNWNCEFEYDNITGNFGSHNGNELMYCYICDLEITGTDLTGYEPSKSNNGGAYAFATAKVVKIHSKQY